MRLCNHTNRSRFVYHTLVIALASLASVGTASAVPMAYGQFTEGGIPPGPPLFGMGEAFDALYFENFSTAGESITQVAIDFLPAAAPLFLDTALAPPGSGSGVFFPVGTLFQTGSTGLTTTTGDFDGSTMLVFDFTDFQPGEAIAIFLDVDGGTAIPYPPGPGEIIGEPDFTGVRFTVTFGDGTVLSESFVPKTDDGPIFSNQASVILPEPSSIGLLLLGLGGVVYARRRRLRKQL